MSKAAVAADQLERWITANDLSQIVRVRRFKNSPRVFLEFLIDLRSSPRHVYKAGSLYPLSRSQHQLAENAMFRADILMAVENKKREERLADQAREAAAKPGA